MKEIKILPKFMPGQVIDISYKGDGLPDRLVIVSVFTRRQDTQWMYSCIRERTGETITAEQSVIIEKMTDKSAKVYQTRDVIGMYNDGWRFCGNFKQSCAHAIASKHTDNPTISRIILKPALNANGDPIPNYYGMWIKHYNLIDNDGKFTLGTSVQDDDIIVIK